jgi:hypothetical protein
MRLPADELEKCLTEFQIVQDADDGVVGAVGIRFSQRYALLHSEGYSDFSVADAARQLFWARVQTLASNHGVFRIWTQERSPFWKSFGFRPPTPEILSRLPGQWNNEFSGAWLTFQLKDEEAISEALEKKFDPFIAAEKDELNKISEKVKTINLIITIVGFAVGIIGIGMAVYLFIHRNPFPR